MSEGEHECDVPQGHTGDYPGTDWECETCGRKWWAEEVDASGLAPRDPGPSLNPGFITRYVPYEH